MTNSKSEDYKQVIVIRKDLNMRKGKMIAQGAHASNMFLFDYNLAQYDYNSLHSGKPQRLDYLHDILNKWIKNGYKKIVLGCESLEELESLYQQALDKGILSYKITDAGLTEFHGESTVTCVSFGPITPIYIDPITQHLKLL